MPQMQAAGIDWNPRSAAGMSSVQHQQQQHLQLDQHSDASGDDNAARNFVEEDVPMEAGDDDE